MNNTTNTTGAPEQQTIDQAEKMFKVVFYVGLFIVGTTGNLLVVIIIKNKRQRTVNDYFIFNLAISDLTFLCFALPFYYYELFEKFVKFHFYCKFVWPMMSVSLFVGIFTLTFMSVERCRAILFPFRPRIKKATLFLAIMLIWTASILCIIPLMIVANPEGIMCSEHWPNESHRKAYTVVLFILQFAVPITVIAVAYITIVVKLIKTKVPNRTSVNHRGQLIKQKHRTENIHIIRTVAIIVILFVACMLPNQIAWILMDFGGDQYKNLSEKFWLFAEALMFLHSCVNPIIYGSLTRQFREGYIKYINYVCCCGRSPQKTMDLSEQRHYHERKSNCSRPQGRLTYRGSLKSPSIVKRLGTGSVQAATVMSSLTYRTSSPKTSGSPSSPNQLSPVLLKQKPRTFKTNLILQNDVYSGPVEVHRNSFPTFMPVGYQDQNIDRPVLYEDDRALINQGVILVPEQLLNYDDSERNVRKPNAQQESININLKCTDSVEAIVMLENNERQDQTQPENEANDDINITKDQPSTMKSNNGHSIPSPNDGNGEIEIEFNNDSGNRRCLMTGPSVNYGITDDEQHCLQDTHL